MVQSRRSPAVLVVEDEADIRDLIVLHLKREGYTVHEATQGEEALRELKKNEIDLILVDWMLPSMSGLEITRAVRADAAYKGMPILMVTARMETTDIVVGLEAGADDYVTKPFELSVLLARVRSLLRRAQFQRGTAETGEAAKPDALIRMGGLEIDPARYEVKCQGETLQLTPSEFKLLLALAQSQGRVLTRDQLIDAVQGSGVTVVDRAVDTHIFGLRKKLGPCADCVETVRGVGYRIKTDHEG